MATGVTGAIPNGHSNAEDVAKRSNSISQVSESSQTAQDYIRSQLQLELDAREALPYQFDTCTKSLGPLRQTVFSCLTCNPPSSDAGAPYDPAGVCYSCSISCHGEHELVELFSRRDFECDCGTKRLPASSTCLLRVSGETGLKGGVHSEDGAPGNKYNHNYKNRFCGCGDTYDAHTEKGTMFQCLGLASEEDGGCGEDWWHPECLLGLPRNTEVLPKPEGEDVTPENKELPKADPQQGLPAETSGTEPEAANAEVIVEPEDPPLPPGFPEEESFEHLICYKCADAQPWIKAYAGHAGFLPAVLHASTSGPEVAPKQEDVNPVAVVIAETADDSASGRDSRKRKAEETDEADGDSAEHVPKKQNTADATADTLSSAPNPSTDSSTACTYPTPPPSSLFRVSLFVKEDFRDQLCRCPKHFPLLQPLPFLLEEEEAYEPPVSEGSDAAAGQGPHSDGSRSLYDRGEAALSAVDRVRAIEGVMAYNHLRDKVKDFLKPFAESGTPVGAEDVKAYFEKLRGDDLQAMRGGQEGADGGTTSGSGGGGGKDGGGGGNDKADEDGRQEQGGY